MAHDEVQHTHPQDPAPESPARAATGVLCLVLFLGSFALFTVGASVDAPAGPWIFTAAIIAFTLAFAIPTTIAPALEARERR